MSTTTWNIDVTHSTIGFSVRHMVVSKVRGSFTKYAAAIQLDDKDLTGSSVEATIEVASIETGVADRDKHLRSPDFFDADKFPTLTFKSTKIEKAGEDRYKVSGDLTIRDVTREVVLDAEFGGQAKDPWGNQRIGFSAKTHIDRKDFGLKWNQIIETGGVLVGERIDLEIEVEAIKAAAA